MIELCDHYEYYSDGRGEINNAGEDDVNEGDEKANPLNIEIQADIILSGYASGPDNLEYSSILPMLDEQPLSPLLVGKKRRR